MATDAGADTAGDGMQCSRHANKSTSAASAGGICAFCLQEKLGRLVSSSSASIFAAAGSSSASPSLRSEASAAAGSGFGGNAASVYGHGHQDNGKVHIPFLLSQKKKKEMADEHNNNIIQQRRRSVVALNRSNSTAAFPRRRGGDSNSVAGEDNNAANVYRRKFWSFLYSSKPKPEDLKTSSSFPSGARNDVVAAAEVPEEINASNAANTTPFERKVSRSRSVGCGSRSFSGDFFDRLGDCGALRRVESHREGRRASTSAVRAGAVIKERVRCAGIFSGFMVTSSSSTSSSSSNGISGSAAPEEPQKPGAAPPAARWRSRSWVWALPSPMRVFGKPLLAKDMNRTIRTTTKSNSSMNEIPSLLTGRDDQTKQDPSKKLNPQFGG